MLSFYFYVWPWKSDSKFLFMAMSKSELQNIPTVDMLAKCLSKEVESTKINPKCVHIEGIEGQNWRKIASP